METENFVELTSKLILLASTTDDQEKARLKKEIADYAKEQNRDEEWERFLKFTEKEISKMPKGLKKEFRTNGLRAHIRKRVRGNSINYEIRCRRQGYNISASGITIEEAKENFIKKLQLIENGRKIENGKRTPTTFEKFALYYFENFRKRKVTERTYKTDLYRLKAHLFPRFGNLRLKDITPEMCQKLIDELTKVGKGKTAEEVFSILNCTFKIAIKHNLIVHNPLDLVIHFKHQRKHGKALSQEEEKRLLNEAEEPFKTLFAIGLYTGIRPNEYQTVRIKNGMIYAKNSKRKNGKDETKRIPITPMLRPYINAETVIEEKTPKQLRTAFNAIFGETHILYDLRTTFYTRCQMCGIAPPARDEFMGHSSGELANAYTDLPDEYLIQEGEKLKY